MMIKESWNLIKEEYNWPNPTKSDCLRSHLPLIIICMQKTNTLIDSFQRYWRSKNPAMGMEERHNWPNVTKSGRLRCHFSSTINSLQYRLIPSREIADRRIQQFGWLRAFLGTSEEADFFWKYSFCRVIEDIVMHHFSCKKRHVNGLNFWEKPNNLILKECLGFVTKMRMFQKSSVSSITDP